MFPDISTVGQIDFEWDFYQEDYEEWLSECELTHSEDTLMEYIQDNVTFELTFFDNDTFHQFDRTLCSYDDIREEYGESNAREVVSQCLEDGKCSLETLCMFDDEVNVNNPDDVNREAMRLLRHDGYLHGARGFILTNGVFVHTPNEHNQSTWIKGVKGTFHFISLGNIRVLPTAVDVGMRPTPEQRATLMKVIASYSGEKFYLAIIDHRGEHYATYYNPDPRYVLGEIDRYFDEGIRPQGRNFYESSRPRTVFLTESQFRRLLLI